MTSAWTDTVKNRIILAKEKSLSDFILHFNPSDWGGDFKKNLLYVEWGLHEDWKGEYRIQTKWGDIVLSTDFYLYCSSLMSVLASSMNGETIPKIGISEPITLENLKLIDLYSDKVIVVLFDKKIIDATDAIIISKYLMAQHNTARFLAYVGDYYRFLRGESLDS